MYKEKYEHTELVIIRFQTADVILTSNPVHPNRESDETDVIPA